MTTWYTADLHFGHKNIIKYCDRPWATAEAMDAGLIERWNSVVGPDDTVWVLGDVALSPKAIGRVADLNGTKFLVAGNHDACWEAHRGHRRMADVYRDAGFAEVYATGIVDQHVIAGQQVRLAHLPYQGDHKAEDRYADRRPIDDGRPLVCGHVHTLWRTDGRQLNVGVDVWDYTPVSAEVVGELIEEFARSVT
jgi:calcineurin-like phosphoesterase family protein